MKILIDARGLLEEVKAGVEGYTYNMLINLHRMYPQNEYILFSYSRSKEPSSDMRQKFNWSHYRWSNLIMSLGWRFLDYPKVDSYFSDIDAIWCPNIRFMPAGEGVKKIVTVHDLSFEILPECYSSRRKLWHWHMNIRHNLHKMDRIIAVSSKTAEDVCSLYDIDPAKVEVIYSGIDSEYNGVDDCSILRKFNLNPNYVLYVSTLEPRKNVYNLLKAYALWRQIMIKKNSGADGLPDLVLVGGVSPECDDMGKYISKLNLEKHIHLLGFVSDEEKMKLIALSRALFYNSYYEGFGFPPLEAMDLGVPVVTSYAGSLGEVTGSNCVVVDPLDVGGMVNAFDSVLFDDEMRLDLMAKGRELVKKYTWENAARDFHGELQSVVGGIVQK